MAFVSNIKTNIRKRFAPTPVDRLEAIRSAEKRLETEEKLARAEEWLAQKEAEVRARKAEVAKKIPPSKIAGMARTMWGALQKGATNINKRMDAQKEIAKQQQQAQPMQPSFNYLGDNSEALGIKKKKNGGFDPLAGLR